MNEQAINKAVDDWVEMERKAKAWDSMYGTAKLQSKGGDGDAFALYRRMDHLLEKVSHDE